MITFITKLSRMGMLMLNLTKMQLILLKSAVKRNHPIPKYSLMVPHFSLIWALYLGEWRVVPSVKDIWWRKAAEKSPANWAMLKWSNITIQRLNLAILKKRTIISKTFRSRSNKTKQEVRSVIDEIAPSLKCQGIPASLVMKTCRRIMNCIYSIIQIPGMERKLVDSPHRLLQKEKFWIYATSLRILC